MHGGAGGGIGGPLPGEPKDPWEVRRQLVSAAVRAGSGISRTVLMLKEGLIESPSKLSIY